MIPLLHEMAIERLLSSPATVPQLSARCTVAATLPAYGSGVPYTPFAGAPSPADSPADRGSSPSVGRASIPRFLPPGATMIRCGETEAPPDISAHSGACNFWKART